MHDLLRSYAAELAEATDPPEARNTVRRRVLDHYLHTAKAAAARYTATLIPIRLPGPENHVMPEAVHDREQALAWFDREQPVLRELIRASAAAGQHRHTWQLVWSLEFFFDRLGHWDEAAAFARLAVTAAGELGDPVARAHAHRSLGRALNKLRHDQAAGTHLEVSLQLFQACGDENGIASSLNYIGFLAERQGRYAEALDHSEQALAAYRRIGDPMGEAMALNSVGNLLTELGRPQQALNPCRQALRVFQDLDEKHGEAAAWDSLGYAHFHLGEVDDAIACYRNAIDIFRASPARYTEAIVLDHFGEAYLRRGDRRAAYEAWRSSAALFDVGAPAEAERVRGRFAAVLQSTTAMPWRNPRNA
jgi:tetratricopeptide (TPR) repeat protein